jgi:hypothetical protein
MNGLEALQRELDAWEEDLARLEAESAADEWTLREHLLATTLRTISAYRTRILPRLAADRVPPAGLDQAAQAVMASYDEIIADELARAVDDLEELRRELTTTERSTRLQLRIGETLATIRTLSTVIIRFGQEVELHPLEKHES